MKRFTTEKDGFYYIVRDNQNGEIYKSLNTTTNGKGWTRTQAEKFAKENNRADNQFKRFYL